MSDYLLEIGTEEMPAHFMPGVLTQIRELAEKKLSERRIGCREIKTLGTPRRLTLLLFGLADKGEDVTEEVRGPAKKAAFDQNGRPTKAAEGFARSQGLAVSDLTVKDMGNGEYLFAHKKVAGQETREVLPEIALEIINSLSFPKPMRWGSLEMRFARPVRWLVSLWNEEVIPCRLENIESGRVTRGHRFLGAQTITLRSPQSYIEQLRENYVLVDQEARYEECWRQIQEVAASINAVVEKDEELLEEVTHLLEWPTALLGSFDEAYLDIPEEVVITPMREHQRYFPVRDRDGKLLNRFITVRNGDDKYLDIVRTGNERVLKARLADARFFWEEDQKQPLEKYLPKLEKIVFQESLGTLAQKVVRIVRNVDYLGQKLNIGQQERKEALRAAELAKADLVTNMVYEFPELQGIMGRYYALRSGESPAIAQAILEHYQPRFSGDFLPASRAGSLVSIADKMDTIAGCFAIGIEPTGSQDPYALRRQALGICLIILKNGFDINLEEIISFALESYQGILPQDRLGAEVREKIMEFMQPRLKNILAEEGHRYDVIEAVLAENYSSVVNTVKRAQTLSDNKGNPEFQEMLTAFTRAFNLTKKAGRTSIEPGAFEDPSERLLYMALTEAEKELAGLKEKGDYSGMVKELSKLAQPINGFFTAVMIMAEDEKVRQNRLSLLLSFVDLTRCLGDLSKIVP